MLAGAVCVIGMMWITMMHVVIGERAAGAGGDTDKGDDK
jgi:hypothetical protein